MGLLDMLFGSFGKSILDTNANTTKPSANNRTTNTNTNMNMNNQPQSKLYSIVRVECPVCGSLTKHKYVKENVLRCYDCGNEMTV